MLKKSIVLPMILCFALSAGSSFSWAQDEDIVKKQTSTGINYVYGGIGSSSQQVMEEIRTDYNFRLTVARPCSGEYLADIKVILENTATHETIMDVISGGPLFFAQLPDGKYKVTAEFEGMHQNKTITIRNNRPREAVFYFAEPEDN